MTTTDGTGATEKLEDGENVSNTSTDETTQPSNPTTWDWDTDPENPYNWSAKKKWAQVGMASSFAIIAYVSPPVQHSPYLYVVLTALSSLGTSIMAPATSQLRAEFSLTTTQSIVPLSLYTFALALGPVLGGPLSETSGRYVTYVGLGTLGALFTLGAGFAQTFAGLCVLRFLAGFCFGPSLAVSAGLLNDIFKPVERGLPSALFILTPFLGPGIA